MTRFQGTSRTGRGLLSLAAVATGLALVVLSIGISTRGPAPALAAGAKVPGQYIVVLAPGLDPAATANEMAREHGLGLSFVYSHALNGFAARIPEARLAGLAADPRVLFVEQDQVVTIAHCIPGNPKHDAHCTTPTETPTFTPTPDPGDPTDTPTPVPTNTPTPVPGGQVVPTGVMRIGGPVAGPVDVDVAVIDTGIDLDHPDLNVVASTNCSGGPWWRQSCSSGGDDDNGHGTHVAGTIGALDNTIGVVGVAPGARLWAVKVLRADGSGYMSWIVAGIDYVTANATAIEVANMSLGCECSSSALDTAITNSVAAGVTYVVAAGNNFKDASTFSPANHDDVITVSALADFNGEPGGGAAATCRTDEDDTFANFSNYGTLVELIAPGVCINSTWPGGGYNTISGTSMASPHVAGAAALYIAANPGATPADVRAGLIGAGSSDWNVATDPDSSHEPLANIAGY